VFELAAELVRAKGRRPSDELRQRTFDAEARSVDRIDVVGGAVYERDVMPRAREMRT
jgi:hypothetical protein